MDAIIGGQWQATSTARQRGAISLVFAMMLLVLIGFLGISLDLGQVYNRNIELQTIANVSALAAAAQLNGTVAGVNNALTQASSAVSALKYQYGQQPVNWNNAALSFSTTPHGAWLDAGAAQANPDGLLFARVDTSGLGTSLSSVELFFMRALSAVLASTSTSARAIAGRSSINVLPLAICALSPSPAAARLNPGSTANTELVEFGFRRGVAYDLMQLNPGGSSPENFVIDPFDPPGVQGPASNTASSLVGPFACSGQLAIARISGGALTVSRPFPLASLFNQLNSRFDQYSGSLCSYATAPPDTNIKSYLYSSAVPWMSSAPGGQSAQSTLSDGNLLTIADPLPAPPGNIAAQYGPLWAYARAVPYSSYVPGATEAPTGYPPFNPSAWSTLYQPGAPTATAAYPAGVSTPYKSTNGSNFLAPANAHKGVANRRVLNVPLLSCPVAAGTTTSATVLGIGKFLMTVPATASKLIAEFGGLANEQALGGAVELYP